MFNLKRKKRRRRRKKKIDNRRRFSKMMCGISVIIFLFVLICGIITCFTQGRYEKAIDLTFYAYAIPASAALSAATIGFNLNYEKSRKMCKEKLRFIKELYNLKKDLGIFDPGEANEMIDGEITSQQDTVMGNLTKQDQDANEPTEINVNL